MIFLYAAVRLGVQTTEQAGIAVPTRRRSHTKQRNSRDGSKLLQRRRTCRDACADQKDSSRAQPYQTVLRWTLLDVGIFALAITARASAGLERAWEGVTHALTRERGHARRSLNSSVEELRRLTRAHNVCSPPTPPSPRERRGAPADSHLVDSPMSIHVASCRNSWRADAQSTQRVCHTLGEDQFSLGITAPPSASMAAEIRATRSGKNGCKRVCVPAQHPRSTASTSGGWSVGASSLWSSSNPVHRGCGQSVRAHEQLRAQSSTRPRARHLCGRERWRKHNAILAHRLSFARPRQRSARAPVVPGAERPQTPR